VGIHSTCVLGLKVVAEFLAFILRIREVPGSHLGCSLKTLYAYCLLTSLLIGSLYAAVSVDGVMFRTISVTALHIDPSSN
jgi:hypothetical protein